MDVRRPPGAEGPAALAVAKFGVYPLLLQELGNDLPGPRRELGVAVGHDLAALVPGAGRRVVAERGVAVVVEKLVVAEQPSLEPVVAMDRGVGGLAGVHQRVDGTLLDFVGQIPRRHRRAVRADFVVDLVVLYQYVEDVGQHVLVVLQRDRQRLGGGPAQAAVRVVEQRQRLGLVQTPDLAVVIHIAGHPPGDLVEEPGEGAPGGVGLAFQNGFLGLAELVRAVAAFLFQEMPVAGQVGVIHQRQREFVLQRRPFEFEEHQPVADRGRCLHDRTQQSPVGRVVGPGGVQQVGVDHRRVHQFHDPLQFIDRRR